MSRRLRKVQESWSRVSSTLAESVSGIRVTQAFVRQDVNAGFFRKLIDVHGENNVGVAQASAVFVPLLQLKSQLFLGAMALLGGSARCAGTAGCTWRWATWSCSFSWPTCFSSRCKSIGNQLNQALMAMAGAERLFRMLDQEPEWRDAPAPAVARHPGPRGISGRAFRIQARPAGADGHFLRGRTGTNRGAGGPHRQRQDDARRPAAKILSAGARRVLVDGVDLNDVTSDSLRSQMGSVQQNNFLFSGSVLDNIRFARPEATEADVRATLAALDCLDLLDALPQGNCTPRWPSAARRCRSASGNWSVSPAPCWRPAHRGAGRGDQRD
jgi:ABC-type multidrug transport system fused ATPase/permease subunit